MVSRTASPFLSTGSTNGVPRAKSPSPLAASDSQDVLPAPTAIRTTTSAALRKGAAGSGAKRTNILGAKKTQKLGAKKVVGEEIDFEAAEKAAKAEADRVEKLGYDPETEKSEDVSKSRAANTSTKEPTIAAPTPISPPKAGYGSNNTGQRVRSPSEVEHLGKSMGRLGFGQIGAKPGATIAATKKPLGFGSTGASRAVQEDDDERYAREKFGGQKGISSDEFFGRNNFDPSTQAEAKGRLQGFEGATSISSNAYFGRPEDDTTGLEGEGYGDLETAARDFVRKFGLTAGDDLENLITVAGEGGRKLRGAVARYLNS